jgi:hypothetical protein
MKFLISTASAPTTTGLYMFVYFPFQLLTLSISQASGGCWQFFKDITALVLICLSCPIFKFLTSISYVGYIISGVRLVTFDKYSSLRGRIIESAEGGNCICSACCKYLGWIDKKEESEQN